MKAHLHALFAGCTATTNLPLEMALATSVRVVYHTQIEEMFTLYAKGVLPIEELSRRMCDIVDQLIDNALDD